ncbi:teichuronic acid biosynthesis protein TuaH [Heyndrickxia ginsengihumi]|uniref:Glycosyltransferase family 1 protein n=1 Tax=Heyndrickxia ginsengihumi TaxID=363870 RepID=A0A0A6XW71_9BACI|nr:glycosyltransferase [Heyndrickxia ginsengihumi]KHD84377.1 teichuronic acid biosynthesis glycosyltransferase tuaH [Heyndrickxia ginsengihumi]MBE6185440.1 glycosyltransferase family 1 protein [Bacillus sp. (in: firmicutes)]MCM3024750.1 glycosyltransferase [Heyndrickxia ginsengihumi]NEY19430.1 glycosyltransferase family 1 protein [Heyndrickxia ginsengihumi]
MKNIHVIVATGEWNQDQLRYRRHRLAEFLQNEPDTEEVIWLCPTPYQREEYFAQLENGIKQWTVQDIFPQKIFRFGRYIDGFYKQKLKPFLAYLTNVKQSHKLYLWYTYPGFPLLANTLSWDKVIYDCSDLWASPISGKHSMVSQLRRKIIAKAEERIIHDANEIFCTSDYLHDQIEQKLGQKDASHVYTYENGVEFSLFTKQLKANDVLPKDFNGTVFGFIGGIKPKLDFQLIQKVARQKRNWLFLFVGPDGTKHDPDFQSLLNEQNVMWIGSVPPEEVPKYMNIIDIGIMPYKSSPYNEAVFPLKLFEFLAAGKPVIGVHLPSTKKYAKKGVYSYLETNDPQSFIREGKQLSQFMDQTQYMKDRIQLAKTKNWNNIFEQMIQHV